MPTKTQRQSSDSPARIAALAEVEKAREEAYQQIAAKDVEKAREAVERYHTAEKTVPLDEGSTGLLADLQAAAPADPAAQWLLAMLTLGDSGDSEVMHLEGALRDLEEEVLRVREAEERRLADLEREKQRRAELRRKRKAKDLATDIADVTDALKEKLHGK